MRRTPEEDPSTGEGNGLVDTQAAFDCVLTDVYPLALASDRVHPNLVGHMILARAFLKALKYAW
jgi:hypothetical protein